MQKTPAAILMAALAAILIPLPAAGQSRPAAAVPASWTRFAAQVGQRLQDHLRDPADPVATRLHSFLDSRPAADPPMPVVRLWFARNGQVTRASFDALGDQQADQDLRDLLMRPAGAAPPAGLRQPLVLRVNLTAPQ